MIRTPDRHTAQAEPCIPTIEPHPLPPLPKDSLYHSTTQHNTTSCHLDTITQRHTKMYVPVNGSYVPRPKEGCDYKKYLKKVCSQGKTRDNVKHISS